MTNGVLPCHVSAYKSYMPLTFDGGASSLCKSLFTPGDFISRSWNGCILVQKTVAAQSVDYSCLFRVMSGNARITLMVRTGGAVYLALRSSSGDVQRICQTTAVPTLGNVMHIGYSWDGSRLALSVYDTTANALVQVVESSTNITSLPAWTEEDGIHVGNRADLSLPYKGNIYGGTFGYGVALSGASMAREAASGNMAFGTRFIIHPQVMGLRGTGIIREPNHNDITVLNPDKTAFWNSNVPSSVIQEWWRLIPTIADIPQVAIVLDKDGVAKQKWGDELVPVPVTIIGSGPLASAPAASVDNLGAYYLETDDPLWPSGRLYTSRYNGNYVNSSVNTSKDNVVPQYSFNANLNYLLTIYFKWSSTEAVPYSILFLQGTELSTTRGLLIGRVAATDSIDVVYHNSDGNIRKTTIPNVVNSVWHKLEVRRVETTVTAYLDGVSAGSISLAGFTVNTPTITTIGAQNGGTRAINGIIAKCSAVCSIGCFDYEFNQASGTAILDVSGNGNNGTLTDALPTDFWKIGWTPVQW